MWQTTELQRKLKYEAVLPSQGFVKETCTHNSISGLEVLRTQKFRAIDNAEGTMLYIP